MQVFCDFDGTIAATDTTDLVLQQLAHPAWEAFEAQWLSGAITAAECMRAQISLIGGDDDQLDAVLDAVGLTPGFVEFAAWCDSAGVPLTIVSDGVDRFIERILARRGLSRIPVIANRLAGSVAAGRALEQPWSRDGCAAASGVCKCQAIADAAPDGPLVFIGDGRSDFCVSSRADLLFARDKLAAYARSRGMPHHEFADFHTITATLDARLGSGARRTAV